MTKREFEKITSLRKLGVSRNVIINALLDASTNKQEMAESIGRFVDSETDRVRQQFSNIPSGRTEGVSNKFKTILENLSVQWRMRSKSQELDHSHPLVVAIINAVAAYKEVCDAHK